MLPDEIPQQDSHVICEGETRADKCHYNLTSWNDGQCKRFLAPLRSEPKNFTVCGGSGERALTIEDILKWKEENSTYE